MEDYLDQDQIDDIVGAVLGTVGYTPDIRALMQAALPAKFAAIMPGGANGMLPMVALRLDLGYLNGAGRLIDGRVPLKVWLQNAVKLAGATEDADPLREALAEMENLTTGAPRVATAPAIAPAAIAPTPLIRKEKLVFRDDMVPFRFMKAGVEAAQAVAKLTVPRYDKGIPMMNGANPVCHLGTGWLIAKDLLMTNHHVINAREVGEPASIESDLRKQVTSSKVLFDYDGDAIDGVSSTPTDLIAWDSALDYALMRVDAGARTPLTLVPQPLVKVDDDTVIAVNIIQHPDGKAKRFGIRNNLVTAATQDELRYFTDTLDGSSGSPVLNDLWQVVAIHCGSAFEKGVWFQGREVPYVNVGTQIHAILADLKNRYQGKIPQLNI